MFQHASLLLRAGLTDLAADDLVRILDALALIRLGGPLLAVLGGEMTDLLLVAADDDELVGGGDLGGDAVHLGAGDQMGAAQGQDAVLDLLASGGAHAVALP